MKRKMRLLIALFVLPFSICSAQDLKTILDLKKLVSENKMPLHNRNIASIVASEYNGISFNEAANYGLAWIPGTKFNTGSIEFDVKGNATPQGSFVGLAFQGVNNKIFDAVYFRPFNFLSPDSLKKAHSVQYISLPKYDWEILRDSFPGKYEHAVNPSPDPEKWFHVLVVLTETEVKVYVNGNGEPSLSVKKLSKHKEGMIGFFVGNNSGGEFANLTFSPKN